MATSGASPVRLFVLGDARIETSRGEIEPTSEVVFAAALYLILERKVVSRRTLQSVLWPSVSTPAAAHRLRQTLLKLRHLGVPVVSRNKLGIGIEAARIETDYEAFVSSGWRAIEGVRSNFALLPGYEPRFSGAFLDWLDGEKRHLAATMSRALLKVVANHRTLGDWAGVESAASSLLELAPFNEEATLALAEACAMRGSKLDGVNILDRYLREIDTGATDLRLPASVMRRRIIHRMPPVSTPSSGITRLIGRGQSMALLGEMLLSVREGKGRTCLVWGDAGIGKSRLMAEFSAFASLQGVSTVRVHCRQSDPFRPLSVFVDMVPTLRGMRGSIGVSPETAKYLDRLTTHGDVDSNPPGIHVDAQFVYARIRQALFDLIDAVSDEAPLLMLIEDVQRLDEVSISLLIDLIPWGSEHRILFAFTSRDNEHAWFEGIKDLITPIHLSSLDIGSSHELLLEAAKHQGRSMSSNYVTWCVRVAEGNPYFLAELASHWIEAGETSEAPPSLASVIRERLSRLTEQSMHLLQACTLLGKNSTLERIEKVLSFEHHALLHGMNELGNAGMLVIESDDIGGESVRRLVPRHELLSNAVEEGLQAPARTFLHRRIGVVLEQEITDNRSAAVLWDAAKHWHQAGNLQQAFYLAQSCTTHLMELGLCGAAAEAYEKALDFCESDRQRLQVLRDQAQAYFRASDWEHLIKTAGKVEALQKILEPDANVHDEVELMTLRAEWQTQDMTVALSHALDCLASTHASNAHRVRAGIMSLMLLDLVCDHGTMKAAYDTLRPLLDTDDVDLSYRFEAGMVYETVCGDLALGISNAVALVQARRESQTIADLMRALTNGAAAARTAGEINLAEMWLQEALTVARSHRLPFATEVPMQILASMALDMDDYDQAREWYHGLLALPESRFDSNARATRDAIGLRISLKDRNLGEARRLLGGEIAQQSSDAVPYRRVYGLALLVAVEIAEGGSICESTVRDLEHAHLTCRSSSRQAFATLVLVAALRRLRQTRRANKILKDYIHVHRREPTPAPMHVLALLESFDRN